MASAQCLCVFMGLASKVAVDAATVLPSLPVVTVRGWLLKAPMPASPGRTAEISAATALTMAETPRVLVRRALLGGPDDGVAVALVAGAGRRKKPRS